VQIWSAVAVPSDSTKVPAGQTDVAEQLAAFSVWLNVPEAHGLQTRSFKVVPSLDTYWPA
jgi:hypothetical protein